MDSLGKKIVQSAKQRSRYFRGKFMADVLLYPREYFVWMDETGADKRDQIRRFGYAIRGEEPVYHCFQIRGRRVSVLAAITSDGLMDFEMIYGTSNADKFFDFVRGSLIPNMMPFPPLDNCSIHHVPYVKDLLQSAGIMLLYLPPYSPDMNPIEKVLSSVKYYLKLHQIAANFDNTLTSAFKAITKEQCNSWINKSGYNNS
jgi:transposase